MSAVISRSLSPGRNRLGALIFRLDAQLRRRHGVYEFTDNPGCIFRIQHGQAPCDMVFSDGTRLKAGDPVLNLHLWNEQVPPMEASGPTMSWARAIDQGIRVSLRELAIHLKREESLKDIAAVSGTMHLGPPEQTKQLVRMAARFGFEAVEGCEAQPALARLGENAMGLLLVLATNPATARLSILRRATAPVFMTRRRLESYGRSERPTAGRKPETIGADHALG